MSLAQDIRYAARRLRHRPLLAATTLLTLSVAIAANAIMFGIVDGLLLRPPAGVDSPDRVRRIYYTGTFDGRPYASDVTVYRVVEAMRRVDKFEAVAGMSGATWTLGLGPLAEAVQVSRVSGNYFALLGVRPEQGRFFAPGEDTVPRGANVAVISDAFWRHHLGASADALGRLLRLEGEEFTVIGVAPPGFVGVGPVASDMFVPISALATETIGPTWYSTPDAIWVSAIARLRPGATDAAANDEATSAYRRERASWNRGPRDSASRVALGSIIQSRSPAGVSVDGKVALWLMGVSVVVLLIACANVANILIARAIDRRREIAIRLAVGAGRTRIARELFAEAALLAGMSVIGALALTGLTGGIVRATLVSNDTVRGASVVDIRVLGATLAIAVGVTLATGLFPAWQATRAGILDALHGASRGIAGGHDRLRFTLLICQTALSALLVIGAGLFAKSLRNVAGRDIGVDWHHTGLVRMDLGRFGFQEPQVRATYAAAAARIARVPGVAAASVVGMTVPMRSATGMSVRVPGEPRIDLPGGGPYVASVTADFFQTTGTRVLRGRTFTPAEDRAPARVMVVNRIVADSYWPNADPIGRCVVLGDDGICTTVVGVVENVVLFSIIRDDRAMLYIPPMHPAAGPPAGLVFRTAGDPDASLAAIRHAIQALTPNMPFADIATFRQLVSGQLRTWQLGATMFAIYGAVALLIAAIGLHGVLAYWVSGRTREIGVRMALGARQGDVVRMVAARGALAVTSGLVLGAVAALAGSRLVAGMLYDTSPRDVGAYALAVLAVGTVAVLASIIPARRCARVDPVVALRAD